LRDSRNLQCNGSKNCTGKSLESSTVTGYDDDDDSNGNSTGLERCSSEHTETPKVFFTPYHGDDVNRATKATINTMVTKVTVVTM
jgi:hypothetical protein